jgi:membrane-associated protease RseP (regulator of RpoE activity)
MRLSSLLSAVGAAPSPVTARLAIASVGVVAALSTTACGAVYPELQTPLRPAAAGATLSPEPPEDLKYIAFKGGVVPEKTVDGRPWHELGNPLPNPFAIIYVNGRAIIKTDPQSNTLTPTWPGSARGNFRVGRNDRVRVEMWEASLTQRPICVKDLGSLDGEDFALDKEIVVKCDQDISVTVAFEPAHAEVGYGFFFEFRTYDVFVSRIYQEGPASRAGLRPGDKIVAVGGQVTKGMDQKVVQSYLNAPKMDGIVIDVVHKDGKQETLTIKEGPVYALYQENAPLDR